MLKLRMSLLVVILTLVATSTVLAGSSSASLSNGANLSVSLDDPLTSTEYLIPSGETSRDVPITGTASVGLGDPDVTLVYVLDVSDSTNYFDGGGDCGGDLNGDGLSNKVLDCEIAAILAVNQAAIDGGSVDKVGVAVYASGSATADMTPAGADDKLTAPDANGDVPTVLTSIFACLALNCGGGGGVGQFQNHTVGNFTDYSEGLAAALSIITDPSNDNGTTIMIFLSDGLSNEEEYSGAFNDRLTDLGNVANTNLISRAFAVGASGSVAGCTGGTKGTLAQIDPSCELIPASELPLVLPDVIGTSLDSVDVTVDGNPVPVTTSAPLPAPGAISVTWDAVAPDLAPGDHVLCATSTGHDSQGSVTTDPTCETIHVYQLSATPENEVNELGTPGQTHTVTGTLAGPLGGLAPVGGRNITFTILSGPNASVAPFVGVTDASGNTDFTYTATQGNIGLGTDVIEACVTLNDPLGETGCETVTKVWADTTPPEFACTPTVNPDGRNTPRANDHNQDGFYLLTATDAVDDDPDIYVVDSGSGTVFGPFPSGTRIKYTEAPGGTPSQKQIGGPNSAVQWHITGTGDMQVYAVDFSGNVGDAITCLVPPPPQ